MVRFQTFFHSGFFVIIPLVKFPTAFVAYVFLFGRIVHHMIGGTTVFADPPAVTRATSLISTLMLTAAVREIPEIF